MIHLRSRRPRRLNDFYRLYWFFRLSSCRSRPNWISRSISSGYDIPEAAHSLGYMLMAVKPGMVLISFTEIFRVLLGEPGYIRKSTRARTEQSTALKALIASCRTFLVSALLSLAGMISCEPSSRYLAL